MNTENTQAQVDEKEVEGMTEPTAGEDDIFNTIFGPEANQAPEAENVVEDKPSDIQPTSDPKSDDSQFQYWQSQADKRSAEVDLLKSQVTELMSKQFQPTEAAPVIEETVLEKPVKPTKPSAFDHSEALTDPDSASAKYLEQQQSYLEDMSDYVSNSNDNYMNQMEQQKQKEQIANRDVKVMRDLQIKYNYTPEQAQDFLVKMSAPDSLSLDNLVQLHQLKQPNAAQEITQVTPEAQRKVETMQSRQEKLSIPKPIGVQPGASDQSSVNTKVEDSMIDSMIKDFNKQNIF